VPARAGRHPAGCGEGRRRAERSDGLVIRPHLRNWTARNTETWPKPNVGRRERPRGTRPRAACQIRSLSPSGRSAVRRADPEIDRLRTRVALLLQMREGTEPCSKYPTPRGGLTAPAPLPRLPEVHQGLLPHFTPARHGGPAVRLGPGLRSEATSARWSPAHTSRASTMRAWSPRRRSCGGRVGHSRVRTCLKCTRARARGASRTELVPPAGARGTVECSLGAGRAMPAAAAPHVRADDRAHCKRCLSSRAKAVDVPRRQHRLARWAERRSVSEWRGEGGLAARPLPALRPDQQRSGRSLRKKGLPWAWRGSALPVVAGWSPSGAPHGESARLSGREGGKGS